MKGIIQDVNHKDKHIRVLINNTWYPCFEKILFPIMKIGNNIEFTIKAVGQYENIVLAQLLTTTTHEPSPQPSNPIKGLAWKLAWDYNLQHGSFLKTHENMIEQTKILKDKILMEMLK